MYNRSVILNILIILCRQHNIAVIENILPGSTYQYYYHE